MLDITNVLIRSPILGIIIYQKKIVFANEYALKLLGYTEDELYKISITDLAYKDDKPIVIKNFKKSLSGEKLSKNYEIRFVKKDGSVIYAQCSKHTILSNGIYSGLIIFYDITQQKYTENIKETLKQINQIIITSLTEEEIYSSICKYLVENTGYKFVCIETYDENNKVISKYSYGKEDVLSEFICEISHKYSEVLNKKEIVINQDLRKEAKRYPVLKKFVKKGFLSSCIIPILKENKVVSTLSIYSEFPNFFTESIIDLLQEMQIDLSYAIEKVERIKHNTIIAEALKHSDTWILVTDENGQIIYVNEAVEKISGYKKEELIGKNPRIFKSGLNPPEFYKEMWDTIISGKIFNAITPNRKKNGEIFHADLKIIPLRLKGDILRFVAVARDITEKIMLSEKINILQNYDALTGLLNLNGLSAQISLKLKETKDKGLMGVFILIDIFKMTHINKILGFSGGDEVLIFFSKKLKEIFEETDTIGRIGADTFGLYIPLDSSYELFLIYSKVIQLDELKFQKNNKSILININAGLALFPKDGHTFRELYEKADITLTKAKNEKPGVIKFFTPGIEKDIETEWNVINLVKKAFNEKLFVLHYQPYYYTDTLNIAGFEALVRIVDNEKIYYPGLFIDYIENSPYLSRFEDWLIKEATEKIKKWNMNISINISGKSFNALKFIEQLSQISETLRDKITIEITERIFIENPENTMTIISRIKKMKNPPKIAIDDFGTGYSSFLYLKDLPIDIIKIDITFIKDLFKNKQSFAVVHTIIDLVRRIDKITLAEGVEQKEQLDILRFLGCNLVQGFLLSKPITEKEVESYIIK